MKTIEFDNTGNILEFHFPDLNELDTITKDLIGQVPNWHIARENDINAFEIGMVNKDLRIPPYNEKLFNWLNTCIAEAVNYYFWGKQIDFAICDAWLTKGTSLKTVTAHYHQNSVLSGILYLTDNNSYTAFEIKPRELEHVKQIISIEDADIRHIKIPSQRGKLILYPSRLLHRVKVFNHQKNVRHTYVFNSFPTGCVSNNSSAMLEYKVQNIKEKYLEYIQN